MSIQLKVPSVGESVTEVTLSKWLVADGDYVEIDQSICEFESDKATLEFPAEKAGRISFKVEEGSDLKIGDVIAELDTDAKAPAKKAVEKEVVSATKETAKTGSKEGSEEQKTNIEKRSSTNDTYAKNHPSPAAQKLAAENHVPLAKINGSGKDGRITKADVLQAVKDGVSASGAVEMMKRNSREEKAEKVSKLRKTIARRLVSVKNETAMLTTFNEADMSAIMELRTKYKVAFEKKHGVGLGFMSFFVRAVSNALEEFPAVNAYWNEDQVIYHDYVDISIAVSTPRGLVVPVLRNAESMSMAGIELGIKELAAKGREGTLGLEEMEGGTFTITNGGVFGSLMSTPIINAPQSAILGMHKIQERPVAMNGQVVIRPMMYLALSYDHRIIDGKESVSFLVRVKEQLENPQQLLFGKDPVDILLDM
ncbi:MAG: 2-oxoglutarate dehydrogenase complex dihydrolipoyllysine-residue succinyltransferase [Chitinophagales bacterium]|nr:2-oxoglutarate dehydrogenase complex dihydrolipoyllysine-residue succinyltransferase [Chitinophagales bacterium]HAE35655.1 dihydrolipoyllysine-residue succinyltransferase [Bacteroidota bacterium]MCB9019815.1 2-oxoglutarate dehydrogenase complex dihydrolipoyllysine-residue succinyltransferase [Chitinophagales bacterium]MCB9021410.1 2-oxoglutarate dehydrogenase complex dihydrolipoyllysine-residue succinyltransferase [Chitinophagales bacterium]MCB9031635.1 2-oxoglutarate dehydrogenase complex d